MLNQGAIDIWPLFHVKKEPGNALLLLIFSLFSKKTFVRVAAAEFIFLGARVYMLVYGHTVVSVDDLDRMDDLHFLRVVEVSNDALRIHHNRVSGRTLKFTLIWLITLISHGRSHSSIGFVIVYVCPLVQGVYVGLSANKWARWHAVLGRVSKQAADLPGPCLHVSAKSKRHLIRGAFHLGGDDYIMPPIALIIVLLVTLCYASAKNKGF